MVSKSSLRHSPLIRPNSSFIDAAARSVSGIGLRGIGWISHASLGLDANAEVVGQQTHASENGEEAGQDAKPKRPRQEVGIRVG